LLRAVKLIKQKNIPQPLKMSEEQWKVIPGYEGYYEISNIGRVKSLTRKVVGRNARIDERIGQEKKTFINHGGRVIVNLSKGGVNKTFQISRLVALTFLPNLDNLPEVDHIDRNPLNNNLTNLRWCSRKTNLENRADFEQPLGVTGERYIIVTAIDHYQVNMKGVCLGTRPTLKEAIDLRESGIIDHKRPVGLLGEQFITTQHNGTFVVRKTTNRNTVHYGTYKTLGEAIAVRNTIPGYSQLS
jgi:hypothetical protein